MSTYTPNIPQPADIPAQSQSQLLNNFTSIDDGTNGFARNHVTLTNATVGQRGKHSFLELINLGAAPSPPAGLAAQEQTYYNNQVTSAGAGGYTQGETFLVRGTSARYIQMTAGKNSQVPANTANSYVTFLPGGFLLQGGSYINSGNLKTDSISYPVIFSAIPLSITLTAQRNSSSNPIVAWVDNAVPPTATSFVWNSDVSSIKVIYWMAIGLA
jgi:hypothetical protein